MKVYYANDEQLRTLKQFFEHVSDIEYIKIELTDNTRETKLHQINESINKRLKSK